MCLPFDDVDLGLIRQDVRIAEPCCGYEGGEAMNPGTPRSSEVRWLSDGLVSALIVLCEAQARDPPRVRLYGD